MTCRADNKLDSNINVDMLIFSKSEAVHVKHSSQWRTEFTAEDGSFTGRVGQTGAC